MDPRKLLTDEYYCLSQNYEEENWNEGASILMELI
jgi:hypothetical protein